jgi:hypothetical protein
MADNFARIIQNNLGRLFSAGVANLECDLPARRDGDAFFFEALGESCRLASDGIILGGRRETGPAGILITLYALHACPETEVVQPLTAFKEIPDSMPYVGAFAARTETVLVPKVPLIEAKVARILAAFRGSRAESIAGGDFSFLVPALPKISLCYIFYRADEEFPASATCLFSGNARRFMPVDGLADVGEIVSAKILRLL